MNYGLIDIFETKWLRFMKYKFKDRKTFVIELYNKIDGFHLGQISWQGRCYWFFPKNVRFDTTCLDDISNYIKRLKNERN